MAAFSSRFPHAAICGFIFPVLLIAITLPTRWVVNGSCGLLMDLGCRYVDLVSRRWTQKVNFVSKVGRRDRLRERDHSHTCKQLLANEVNTRASRSWRSKCLEQLAGIGTFRQT